MDAKMSHQNSADNATRHFWYQRITAITLIPLSIWGLVLFNKALHAPYAETADWIRSPVNAAIIIVWIIAVFYHAALGIQVVIEDYVSTRSVRLWVIRIIHLIFSVLGIAALAAMIYILLQGNYDISL